MSSLPPLPAGFTLDNPEQAELPPLPAGFTLDQPQSAGATQPQQPEPDQGPGRPKMAFRDPNEVDPVSGRTRGQMEAELSNYQPSETGRGVLRAFREGLRQAGQKGKQVAEGGLSSVTVPLDLMGGLMNLAMEKSGINYRFGSAGRSVSDALADPRIEEANASERLQGDLVRGVTGAMTGLGAARAIAARAAIPLTTGQRVAQTLASNPGAQVASAATGATAAGAAREGGAGPVGQTVAGFVGALAPGALPAAGAAVVRGVARGGEAGRQAMTRNIENFAASGTTPSVGQATENRGLQATETLLSNVPGGAGPMARKAATQAEELGQSLQNRAAQLSKANTAEQAGTEIRQGGIGEGGFMDRFKAQSEELFNKLDDYLPADSRVRVGNTKSALASMNKGVEGAPEVSRLFRNPKIEGIEKALDADMNSARALLARPDISPATKAIIREVTDRAKGGRATTDARIADLEKQITSNLESINAGQAKEAAAVDKKLQVALKTTDADYQRNVKNMQSSYEEQLTALDKSDKAGRLFDPKYEAELQRSKGTEGTAPERLAKLQEDRAASAAARKKLEDSLASQRAKLDENYQATRGKIEHDFGQRKARIDEAYGLNRDALTQQKSLVGNIRESKLSPNEGEELLSQLKDGTLPYEGVKRLRSLVGAELSDWTIMSTVPKSKYKQLYAALTADLESAARDTGDPRALQAFTRANNYYRSGAKRAEAIGEVIGRDTDPEKIFAAAMSGSNEGGTRIRRLMRSLPERAQKATAATVLRRLGRATAGNQNAEGDAFSTETFLTQYSKLSPEAKSALFDRYGKAFTNDLNKIAQVAGNLRRGSRVFRNPSGTAPAAAQIGAVTSGLVALVTGHLGGAAMVAAGVGGANGAARLMTNPKFVHWLARATEAPKASMPALVQQLVKDPDPDFQQMGQLLQGDLDKQDNGG